VCGGVDISDGVCSRQQGKVTMAMSGMLPGKERPSQGPQRGAAVGAPISLGM
jgi:hypothetical protein